MNAPMHTPSVGYLITLFLKVAVALFCVFVLFASIAFIVGLVLAVIGLSMR